MDGRNLIDDFGFNPKSKFSLDDKEQVIRDLVEGYDFTPAVARQWFDHTMAKIERENEEAEYEGEEMDQEDLLYEVEQEIHEAEGSDDEDEADDEDDGEEEEEEEEEEGAGMIGGGRVTITRHMRERYGFNLFHPASASLELRQRQEARHWYILNRAIHLWDMSDRPDINVNTQARLTELLDIFDDDYDNFDWDQDSDDDDDDDDDDNTDDEIPDNLDKVRAPRMPVHNLPVGAGYGSNSDSADSSDDDEIKRIQLPAHPITHFGYARSF